MTVKEQNSRHRAEALAQEVETLATTLERTRIAREIHDSLGHTLTNLDTRLAVAQTLRKRDIDAAFQAVDTAKFLASQCIEEVGQALQMMRKSDFDLYQALRTLLEQLQSSSKIQVRWEMNLPPLPSQTSYHLYCMIKEGLINIQKHARADQIWLRGWVNADLLIVEINDNGQGFDPKAVTNGFGLKGIGERACLLGGNITHIPHFRMSHQTLHNY